MTPTLVLAAHGSRDPRFAVTAERVRHAVDVALPGVAVELAYLDLNEPTVGDALSATTGSHVVVVPLLFSTAFHATVDLPAIIDAHRADDPDTVITQTATLGGDDRLIDALADRLADIGTRPDDGVIVCAVGSRDPASDGELDAVARRLSDRLGGAHVQPLFATRLGAGGVNLRSAIDGLRAAGARRIALSPYFLSAGTLTDRVENALDAMAPDSAVAAPIGPHPGIVAIICERYRSALAMAGTRVART
ncbi:sirohydrochlorin chelatase [Williamsia phyllosphaerae]|uniref:Ferrochelatase n=1 Tax=Williamsia phyllosphaerae TaxID=885042 RepID=A0ABQ1UYQ5_9NOCA|nr:sirohydrochlorin chelatase [Williamsia phyllosphaerae]GGF28337.1 ferrochelatase [Williamsia phyllosphaerae]